MAYDKDEMEKMALLFIKTENVIFFDELKTLMPCSRSTCYALGLDKLDSIKEAIWRNRAKMVAKQNKKWYVSDNATLQVSLRKLIGSDQDRRRLSQSYQDITTDGEKLGINIELDGLDEAELEVLMKLHAKRKEIIASRNPGTIENT